MSNYMLNHWFCGTELTLPKDAKELTVQSTFRGQMIALPCPKCQVKVLLDLQQFFQACQEYRAKHGRYPGEVKL